MTDTATLSMPNLADFLRELQALPRAIRERAVKGAVATAASVVRKDAIARAPLWLGSDKELMGMIGQRTHKMQAGHPPPGTLKKAIYQTRMVNECTDTLEVWKVDVSKGKDKRNVGKKTSKFGPVQGMNKDAYYAAWVEYGHFTRTPKGPGKRKARQLAGIAAGTVRWVPPQPFMRPAFETKKTEALNAMAEYLRREIHAATDAMRYIKATA